MGELLLPKLYKLIAKEVGIRPDQVADHIAEVRHAASDAEAAKLDGETDQQLEWINKEVSHRGKQ